MRTTREVLRLRFDAKLSYSKIATSCRISSSTASDVVRRFRLSGLQWPLPAHFDDNLLDKQLYRDKQSGAPPDPHVPDWDWVHSELRKHKHVTLQVLWEEYKLEHPEGYHYSWFCERYTRFRSKLDPVLRQIHKMGEKCFVDYAGPTVPIVDAHTGEVRPASIFVGILGASNYTFAEATWSQELPHWLGSHVRMYRFFGGVAEITVPDNLRSGVKKADRYEPDINPAYNDLAMHYGTAVIPARVRRPRDKAKVENAVLIVERWILAAVRHRTFYTLDELNEAIDKLLKRLNERPFKKMSGSRKSLFEEQEKPMLRPLPAEPYEFAQWKKARVNIDYHIELERCYYSVPYQLLHEEVLARLTATTVEIFHRGNRIASHRRLLQKGAVITLKEHMPPKHAQMLKWTPERLLRWATKIGPNTLAVVQGIMERRAHPQQGFRACLGVLNLARKHGGIKLEAACQRAAEYRAFTSHSVRSILENGLYRLPSAPLPLQRSPITHDNVRGAAYYRTTINERSQPVANSANS